MRQQLRSALCGLVAVSFFVSYANAQDAPSSDSEAPAAAEATPTPASPQDKAGKLPEASEDKGPVNIRLRQLEQRVQALKERAWRAKARVGMLKEAVLGGGVGARAGIVHENKMGNSYRLLRLVYALDGTQVYTRSDASGALHEQKTLDILTGPIAPGSHTVTVLAEYRGNGYGVFKYLNKYRFKVRASHTFTASEGKAISIRVIASEKGGITAALEDRPAIEFKVAIAQGTK